TADVYAPRCPRVSTLTPPRILCVLRDERRRQPDSRAIGDGRAPSADRSVDYACVNRCKLMGGSMLVREGKTDVVLTVGPDHTLREAAAAMCTRRVGAAVVIDPDAPGPGMITERDLLLSVGAGENPEEERVADHLTSQLTFAAPDWSLEQAAAAMVRGGFRHLVGAGGRRDRLKRWISRRPGESPPGDVESPPGDSTVLFGQRVDVAPRVPDPDRDRDDQDDDPDEREDPRDRGPPHRQGDPDRAHQRDQRRTGEVDLLTGRRRRVAVLAHWCT